MNEIECIINEVGSSMSMARLPLTDVDKENISMCLNNPGMFEDIINGLLIKHTVRSV